MRVTVNLDDDVVAAVERLRRDRSIGLSEAINELIRAGLTVKRPRKPFRQQSEHIGFKVDVTNVAEALEQLEVPTGRARSTRSPPPG
jgi:metal-responsive CopG/Arc/MetJ family transcriptional regulator